jgi:hypothetical protein
MPIKFEKQPVRIVSAAILKETRKRSHYKVAIVEPLGSRLPEHWYANTYPETIALSKDAYDHVAPLTDGVEGATIYIDGQVRKYAKGESQNVVIDVTAAHPYFSV